MKTEKFVVIPNANSHYYSRYSFESGQQYEVKEILNRHVAAVIDGNGNEVIVRCDGAPSSRLEGYGNFRLFNAGAFEQKPIRVEHAAVIGTTEPVIRVQTANISGELFTMGIISNASTKANFETKCAELVTENNRLRAERDALRTQMNELIEVNELLREALRTPEGENVIRQAKAVRILADTALKLVGQI